MSTVRRLPIASVASSNVRAERPLRRDLFAGHLEAMAYGGMVGFGETFLPAYALAAGLGEVTAGLVASVPMLAGGLVQMYSPLAIRRLASNRLWVVISASIQALSFGPLVYFALRGQITATMMFIIASVYWGAGLATGPAWNSWMGMIIPRYVRARYFACRTRLSQATVLSGFLAGGAMLQLASKRSEALPTFAILFVVAGLFRLGSALCLLKQSEPDDVPIDEEKFSALELIRRFRGSSSAPLLMYLAIVQSAVQFAGPYFAPYMFEKLHLSYAQFVILTGTSFVAKIISLPAWGRVAQRVGAFRLLCVGGVGVVPIASMWLVSDSMYWLMVVQLVGGIAWAAYELAFFLLFFESIPEDERTAVLTVYNLANTTAWVSGSILGGLLLHSLGAERYAYYMLFALSTVGRGAALVLLNRVVPTQVQVGPIGIRTLGIEPSAGSIDAPILPSLPDQAPKLLLPDAASDAAAASQSAAAIAPAAAKVEVETPATAA